MLAQRNREKRLKKGYFGYFLSVFREKIRPIFCRFSGWFLSGFFREIFLEIFYKILFVYRYMGPVTPIADPSTPTSVLVLRAWYRDKWVEQRAYRVSHTDLEKND